jgi:hypothetical protein
MLTLSLLVQLHVHVELRLLVFRENAVELFLSACSLQTILVFSQLLQLLDLELVFDLLFCLVFVVLDIVQVLLQVTLDHLETCIHKLGLFLFVLLNDFFNFLKSVFQLLASVSPLIQPHFQQIVLAILVGMHHILDILHFGL